MMKGLLVKDFKLMKNQKNFFLMIFLLSIAFMGMDGGENFIVGFLTFICSLFSISTISYDEFDNGNAFLFTLPFNRADYVREKYCFGLITGIAACVVGTIISGAAIFIKNTGVDILEWLPACFTFIIIDLLFLSFLLPFQLKFGAERGRIALLIGFGILFVIAFLAVKLMAALKIDIDAIVENMTAAGVTGLFVFCFFAVAACTLVSYRISRAVVNHKEF